MKYRNTLYAWATISKVTRNNHYYEIYCTLKKQYLYKTTKETQKLNATYTPKKVPGKLQALYICVCHRIDVLIGKKTKNF